MSAVAGRRKTALLSAEDYLAFLRTRPDKERWQLIDGTAVMMAPPTLLHQRISLNLCLLLNEALARSRPDLVAMYELGITIPGFDAFLPEVDVAVLRAVSELIESRGLSEAELF